MGLYIFELIQILLVQAQLCMLKPIYIVHSFGSAQALVNFFFFFPNSHFVLPKNSVFTLQVTYFHLIKIIMIQIVKDRHWIIFVLYEATRPLHINRQQKIIIIPKTLIIIKFQKINNKRKWLGKKVKVNHTKAENWRKITNTKRGKIY